MGYTLAYYSKGVQEQILELPDTREHDMSCSRAEWWRQDRISANPIPRLLATASLSYDSKQRKGLPGYSFAPSLAGAIIMLHSFIKKSERTPQRERDTAETPMKKVKRANS